MIISPLRRAPDGPAATQPRKTPAPPHSPAQTATARSALQPQRCPHTRPGPRVLPAHPVPAPRRCPHTPPRHAALARCPRTTVLPADTRVRVVPVAAQHQAGPDPRVILARTHEAIRENMLQNCQQITRSRTPHAAETAPPLPVTPPCSSPVLPARPSALRRPCLAVLIPFSCPAATTDGPPERADRTVTSSLAADAPVARPCAAAIDRHGVPQAASMLRSRNTA